MSRIDDLISRCDDLAAELNGARPGPFQAADWQSRAALALGEVSGELHTFSAEAPLFFDLGEGQAVNLRHLVMASPIEGSSNMSLYLGDGLLIVVRPERWAAIEAFLEARVGFDHPGETV